LVNLCSSFYTNSIWTQKIFFARTKHRSLLFRCLLGNTEYGTADDYPDLDAVLTFLVDDWQWLAYDTVRRYSYVECSRIIVYLNRANRNKYIFAWLFCAVHVVLTTCSPRLHAVIKEIRPYHHPWSSSSSSSPDSLRRSQTCSRHRKLLNAILVNAGSFRQWRCSRHRRTLYVYAATHLALQTAGREKNTRFLKGAIIDDDDDDDDVPLIHSTPTNMTVRSEMYAMNRRRCRSAEYPLTESSVDLATLLVYVKLSHFIISNRKADINISEGSVATRWGLIRFLIINLFQIYCGLRQWENFSK